MLLYTFQSNAQAQARRRWANLLISAFLCTYSASHSWAQEPESEEYVSGRSSIALIGLSAQPASLESGQSTGVAINYTHLLSPPKERGIQFRLGGLMSYEEVNENSLAWSVHHQILRLGVEQENTWQLGRGSFGLTLGLAGLTIMERQTRLQAKRLAQGEDQKELALYREASVFLPEVSIAPTSRLKLIQRPWGTIGLLGRLMFTYHPLNDELPRDVKELSWGALFGVFFTPSSRGSHSPLSLESPL